MYAAGIFKFEHTLPSVGKTLFLNSASIFPNTHAVWKNTHAF